jgi:CO/xanthine dehydrogenase FAD-binding subunit
VDYLVPDDVAAAIEMRAAGVSVLAGGTDFYPSHVGRPLTRSVVDIGGLSELRGIVGTRDVYRIGALTRWADVAAAPLPPCFDGLRAAAREVGSVQVQNSGTVGGNLCNASPAADGVPPLLTLDASVELTSTAGSRVLTLEEFLTGYRQTALRPDELLTAVLVRRGHEDARSEFLKLGLRRYLVISVVMVAAVVVVGSNGRVAEARIAVGACSPVAQRLRSLETDLVDRSVDEDLGASATTDHLSVLSPIDDVRGTAAYRLEAALALVRRALTHCGGSR